MKVGFHPSRVLVTTSMHNSGQDEVSYHFAVGRIRYPASSASKPSTADHRHGTGAPSSDDSGILVYIKLGRVFRDFSPDMLNYIRQVNPNFPHDTTADQQFNQAQFESYRQPGYQAGRSVTDSFWPQTELESRFQELDRRYRDLLKQGFTDEVSEA